MFCPLPRTIRGVGPGGQVKPNFRSLMWLRRGSATSESGGGLIGPLLPFKALTMRSVFQREQKSQAPSGAASARVGFEALAWKLGGVGRLEGPRDRRRRTQNLGGSARLRVETEIVLPEARTWGTKRLVIPPFRARALRPPPPLSPVLAWMKAGGRPPGGRGPGQSPGGEP